MRIIVNRPETGIRNGGRTMQSITGDKSEKALFVICNLALVVVWLNFLIRLITRWNAMAINFRYEVALFMMFFSFWWLTLVREKRGFISLLMAGGVLVTVYEIVRTFM
ncbi:MAG: hypothetical protein ABI147_00025 [Acidobacteriaceae bacterium]